MTKETVRAVCTPLGVISILVFAFALFGQNGNLLLTIGPLVAGLACMLGLIWSEPTHLGAVNVILTAWCILLVLGTPPALIVTGMAFEGGRTLDAYLVLIATWSYPPLVAVAYFYRRRKPVLVWLPLLTLFLFIGEQLVWHFGVRVTFSD